MKPNFALRLTHESVELLHRGPAGWVPAGKTAFDVPDLDAAMAALRAKAAELAPEGVFSKLILPASEIRFDRVPAPGPTDEARRLQIEAEIEGLTPYTLAELAYDFVIEDDLALVALCAREILTEAEGFALKHGFAPLSFVAQPAPGAFTGEPFFGQTAAAPGLLPRGERFERDGEPVRLAGAGAPAPRPAAAPVAPPAPASAPSAAPAAPDALSRVGELVRRMGTRIRREQAAAPQAPAASPAPSAPPRPAAAGPASKPPAAPMRPAVASPARPAPVSMPPRPAAATGAPASARFRPVAAPVAAATARATPEPTPEPVQAEAVAPQREPVTPPVQAAAKPAEKPDDKPAETPAAETPATKPDAKPVEAKPAPAAPVAFASRRGPAPTPSAAPQDRAARPVLASSGPGAARPARSPGGRLAILPDGQRESDERPGLATRLARRARRMGRQALVRAGLAERRQGGKKNRKAAEQAARKTLPEPIVAASKPPANEREKATEAEALTIFGARPSQRIETGFARRGLILTGGLILLLFAVGIWAFYFTTVPQREAEVAALSPAPAPITPLSPIAAPESLGAPAAAPVETTPEPAPEPASETVAAAEPEAPATEPVAAAPVEAAPDPDTMLETLVQEALREALPAETLEQALDQSEALAANPAPETEAMAQAEAPAPPATVEPAIEALAEAAPAQRLAIPPPLERPALSEVALAPLAPPPPFGTEFNLGADGLVEATREGALSPAGVMVYARPPTEVPPRRPGSAAPVADQAAVVEPAPAPAAAPAPVASPVAAAPEPVAEPAPVEQVLDDTPRADPALAGFRPEPRSPRVAEIGARSAPPPETPASNPEDDSSSLETPAPGGVSLAALRPQPRPSDLVEATPASAPVPDTETAPEAVATSLRPTARPDALSARVQEALAASRSPAPAAQPAAAPAATAAAAQPNIPTSASVAQQATQARAINLRRINLIGVFGTPADRRALVRLSDGRVVRVQVGDRLDGGQVSAIGDNELRYVRHGRNEILRIGESG